MRMIDRMVRALLFTLIVVAGALILMVAFHSIELLAPWIGSHIHLPIWAWAFVVSSPIIFGIYVFLDWYAPLRERSPEQFIWNVWRRRIRFWKLKRNANKA